MTKNEALHSFFSGFGLGAYPASNVPDRARLPYLTYSAPVGAFGDTEVNCTVNIYYYTTSEAIPNNKADEISKAIGLGGTTLKCNDGFIWVKRGNPWCTPIAYDGDPALKRRMLNVTLEFNTL